MTMNSSDSPVRSVRKTMNKRLGEIISGIIGDSSIQELFERAGGHPDKYKGLSTGEIALDLGAITEETKTALLVAQAAERTARLADDVISGKNKMPRVFFDGDLFEFVGSYRDPGILRHARATRIAAQIFHDDDHVFRGHGLTEAGPAGKRIDYAKGFKAAASELYAVAGAMLDQEGHSEAAKKLGLVSESLWTETAKEYSPNQAMWIMAAAEPVGSGRSVGYNNFNRGMSQDVLWWMSVLTLPEGRVLHRPNVRPRGNDTSLDNG
ncbi:MAG: hypothetical protein PHS57_05620 [Alphaproteobacteria bacterium]|nr:hypothetical protein [Alphaproteobacteria bacterium]